MDVVRHAPLPDGPKIISANHPSTTDPFLILTLASEQVSILISETLFKVPLFGRYLRQAGHVPVVPGNGRAAFEKARQLLDAGRTVAVFPEGAISPLDGGFHRPHTGAARLSLITGTPVIPIGIHLQRERMRLIETVVDGKPEVGTWYLRGPYAMTVGNPMRFTGDVEDRAYVRSASERTMQHIAHLAHQSARRIRETEGTTSYRGRRTFDPLSTIRRAPATIGRSSSKR
jgi:1-acyl-sn-glycerol-3-phosphate acyltransferase